MISRQILKNISSAPLHFFMEEEEISELILKQKEDYLLITSFPKSGSSFVAQVLSKLTGYSYFSLISDFSQEHDFEVSRILECFKFGTVSQLHTKGTSSNVEILCKFEIKPVIMVRNLYDVVMSLHDHLYKESLMTPIAYISPRYFELDEHDQIDFIIDFMIPWYINFYVCWYESCMINKNIESLWISYEELNADNYTVIHKITDYYNINTSESEIHHAISKLKEDKHKIRFNKGVIGRGKTELTKQQRDKIVKLTQYYPWVDFSRIGIENQKVKTISTNNMYAKLAEFRSSALIPFFINPRVFYDLLNIETDVAIFGAGESGRAVYQCLQDFNKCTGSNVNVTAFFDNNPSKWETDFCGVAILKPNNLSFEKMEKIIIASDARQAIYDQLKAMNIDNDKII